MHLLNLTVRTSIGCVFVFAGGCYAAREPVPTPDAFHAPDGGTDAYRFDAAQTPDAILPDAFAPDVFTVPDAWQPDAWRPELGADCSLGGTGNAYSLSGGPLETPQREVSPDGWVTYASTFDMFGRTGHRIIIETPSLFLFDSPDEMMFAPGEYLDTRDIPAPEGHAGVWIVGSPCGGGNASLNIHEVIVEDGVLRRFRASFQEACGAEPFVGCIRYTAP